MSTSPVAYYDEPDASYGTRVFAIHQQDIFPSVEYPDFPPSYTEHLLVDTATADAVVTEYDADQTGDTGIAYVDEEVISTHQVPACGGMTPNYHGSMASDACMPTSATNQTSATFPVSTASTATLHLFVPYLEALCSL